MRGMRAEGSSMASGYFVTSGMTAGSLPSRMAWQNEVSWRTLAPISKGQTPGESIAASVALAQQAERSGYRRVWYAEHHNMPAIASSATSVLIAHVGAHTSSIRLGAGGIMLPNHSPLTIAEQFGTLEAVHPGRIDLGLGRT